MGLTGTHLRADADAARDFARFNSGGLPSRRLDIKHYHTAYALLPARRGLLPEIREEYRHRYGGRHDAALHHEFFRPLDRVFITHVGRRNPLGVAGELQLLIRPSESPASVPHDLCAFCDLVVDAIPVTEEPPRILI